MTTANPDRIYQARLAADMSRTDLAHAIRIHTNGAIKASERSVRRWEKGEHAPSDGVIPAIAQATGKDIDFFYEQNGDGSSDDEDESSMHLTVGDMVIDLTQIVRLARKPGSEVSP